MGEEQSRFQKKDKDESHCERNDFAGAAIVGTIAIIGLGAILGAGLLTLCESANKTEEHRTYSNKRCIAGNTDSSSRLRFRYPKNWSISKFKRGEEHFCRIECTKDSNEFQFVENQIRKSMPMVTVMSVTRIENKKLYDSYKIKKIEMKRLNGGYIFEKRLFHGTAFENISSICHQGFDLSLSGKGTGNKYGKGIYFAKYAKYSDHYSVDTGGIKRMFLANVLVGNYTTGNPCYNEPPLDTMTYQLYDSCVDKMIDPTVFVIFDSSQACPEYFITYY